VVTKSSTCIEILTMDVRKTEVTFYWDQPFQPKSVLLETVEVFNRTLFQPFLVDMRL